jgi:hypothetical protein
VKALVSQLRVTLEAIGSFAQAIAERAQHHPDCALFEALPGAGAALAPRLLARLSGHRLLTQQEDGAKPLTLLDLGLFCPAKNCIHNLSKALFLIFKGLTRF